ncbi:MAG: hypothetical protein RIB54_20425 [Fulvivirga sp.]|uniref:hypothetical protein n=1 Tax=Fulvivirga sp. TaxID=1931237 RepID=UPI0032EEFFB1
MKKFIFKTSIFSVTTLFILVSVNYLSDSAKIFHEGYEKKISKIIFSNHNATNISNYDERILQKELISELNSSPDILILGSSRTMLINSTYFKTKKVINNSVTGASIEDLIAVYQMYVAKNKLPEKIILGIDPWLFNVNNGLTRWKSLEKEYYGFSNKKSDLKKSVLNNKVKQLFSFSYFQASFGNLPNLINGNSEPVSTDEIYNQTTTKLVDASLSYGKKYREASIDQVNSKAKKYTLGSIYSIEKFNDISSEIFQEFENLCFSILQNDIELSFFLSPYHPIVFEKINEDYQIVLEVENKVLQFANKKGIKCLGSFSPQKAEVNNSDFYDGMHCKEEAIKKIMRVQTNNNDYKPIGNW